MKKTLIAALIICLTVFASGLAFACGNNGCGNSSYTWTSGSGVTVTGGVESVAISEISAPAGYGYGSTYANGGISGVIKTGTCYSCEESVVNFGGSHNAGGSFSAYNGKGSSAVGGLTTIDINVTDFNFSDLTIQNWKNK